MRKYQQVWELLKQNGACAIVCPAPLVRRVKRGVIKEKDDDKVFKALNTHDHFYLKISYTPESSVLRFDLKQSIGILEGRNLTL